MPDIQITNNAEKHRYEAFIGTERAGYCEYNLLTDAIMFTHTEVLEAVNHLSLGGGTSLAQGILTSLDAIAGRTLKVSAGSLGSDSAPVHIGYYGGATIVLLSDGEDTSQTGPDAFAIPTDTLSGASCNAGG